MAREIMPPDLDAVGDLGNTAHALATEMEAGRQLTSSERARLFTCIYLLHRIYIPEINADIGI